MQAPQNKNGKVTPQKNYDEGDRLSPCTAFLVHGANSDQKTKSTIKRNALTLMMWTTSMVQQTCQKGVDIYVSIHGFKHHASKCKNTLRSKLSLCTAFLVHGADRAPKTKHHLTEHIEDDGVDHFNGATDMQKRSCHVRVCPWIQTSCKQV